MPDRLAELRRQRALVQEHLAWLDREIAASEPGAAKPRPVPPVPVAASAPTPAPTAVSASAAPAGEAKVDEILERYRSAPAAVRQDVRKGCLLYFSLALAVFAAVTAVLYFTLMPR